MIMKRRFKFRILGIYFLIFLGYLNSFAQSPLLLEENEMIMAVFLDDGTMVADSMTVYRLNNQWFLPLTQFTESLSVSISVSPALGKAQGNFLGEERPFELDQSQCQAQVGSQLIQFGCQMVVVHDDEVYVDSRLLEQWFPMKLKIDSFSSEIKVSSPFKFPAQERRERERKAITAQSSKASAKPEGYDSYPVESRKFAGPLMDQQLSYAQEKNSQTFRHDTAGAVELFGFETKAVAGGTDRKMDNWSLNLAKKDPDSGLLGGLKAREVQAFDFSLPSIPLIGGSKRARGLMISSFPLSQPSNFSSRDFRGPLPSGWEVEIYQNDLLIDRQIAGNATEYEFKNLQLVYGLNRFRLVFYGPQGQRREEIEVVNIGANLIRPQEQHYRFAIADSPADTRSILQYQKGISSNWTAGASYLRAKPSVESDSLHYGLLNFNGSFSRMIFGLNAATTSEAGTAFEETIQAPFDRGSIGLSQAQLTNFRSDVYNASDNLYLNRVTKLNGAWGFPNLLGLRLMAEVSRNEFPDLTTTTGAQRSSLQTGATHWFNTFNYESEAPSNWTGQLSAMTYFKGFEIRPQVDYSRTIHALGSSLLHRLTDTMSIEASARNSLQDHLTEFQLTVNRLFQALTLSAEAATNSREEYRVMALLSYGAALEPRERNFYFSSQPQTEYGGVSVEVFLDMDQNGKFNEGDTPLHGVQILVNQNESKVVTNSLGTALLTRLPVHEAVDLSISSKSLSDPLYKPAKKGIRLVPRPGHIVELSLPVIIQSEVEGLIQIESLRGLRGRGQIEIQLQDSSGKVIQSSKSAADGYFFIENISAGEYELVINPDQLEMLKLKSRPLVQKIIVPQTGLIDGTYDFTLEKIQSSRPHQ